MISPKPTGTRTAGTLLLADISGYTGFLHGVADAHRALIIEADEPPIAYAVLSNLLDAMIAALAPDFRLIKVEGDALFVVADDPSGTLRGDGMVSLLRRCHAAFADVLATASTTWTCTCDACSIMQDLGVKFVVHHGVYVTQVIVGREELAGPDVIVSHRLLKNHVRDLIGPRPYALLTDEAIRALDVPVAGMVQASETYDGQTPIAVHVLALA